MTSLDTTAAYNMGYGQGQHDLQALPGNQNSVVVLAFGQPTYESGSYGTYLTPYPYPFASNAQIAEVAKAFGHGYWLGTENETGSQLTIAIGTSNYGTETTFYNHGQAWAQMVNSVQQYFINSGYASQVTAQGASDMELMWGTPTKTRSWVDGYDSANNQFLYNFGDAAGCPQSGDGTSNGTCSPGGGITWTQEDVRYISWGAQPCYPLPQIYTTNGSQANEWQQISLYSAVSKGGAMLFKGSFTQQGACSQKPAGTCDGIDNGPDTGWSQLWDALHSDYRTAVDLPWSTDIRNQ